MLCEELVLPSAFWFRVGFFSAVLAIRAPLHGGGATKSVRRIIYPAKWKFTDTRTKTVKVDARGDLFSLRVFGAGSFGRIGHLKRLAGCF